MMTEIYGFLLLLLAMGGTGVILSACAFLILLMVKGVKEMF